MTKTLQGKLWDKPLFVTAGIADQLHQALILAIWAELSRWQVTHPREWLFTSKADRDTEVWIIDDGDHATMLFPDER